MESAPLQRVSVAQCDHTTAGGRQTPHLTRRSWKAYLEFKIPAQIFWKALGKLKRQDGVGASPKGQCRLVRPYDSWRAPDAILTRRSWKASLELQRRIQVFWKALGNLLRQDGVGATPKGQCRPVQQHDSWRAPDAISDPEVLESFIRVPAWYPSLLECKG